MTHAPVIPPCAPSMAPEWRRAGIAVAVLALLAVRGQGRLADPQFWAEDGAVFFLQSENAGGGWGLLPEAYEGYLHLLPRLVAALGHGLPTVTIPAFYSWTAWLLTGAVAWAIQSPRIRLPGAWVAALALAAVPHTGEVYFNLANFQWIAAVGLFALVVADDAKTGPQRAGDIGLLVCFGLTGPFVVLALPLLAWRAWRRRSAWSVALLGLAAVCAAAHAASLLARPSATDPSAWAPLHHAAMLGSRIVVTTLAGPLAPGEAVCAELALAVACLLAWGLLRFREAAPGGLALLAACGLLAAATGYKARVDHWDLTDFANGDRYFYTIKVLLVWTTAALAHAGGPRLRRGLVAMLVLPLVTNAQRFVYPPFPDLHWREHAERIERGERTEVPIQPEGSSFVYPGRLPAAPQR